MVDILWCAYGEDGDGDYGPVMENGDDGDNDCDHGCFMDTVVMVISVMAMLW